MEPTAMNAYNQYQENQILSASAEQILLMLYDGAIRFTRQAITGIESNNLSQFHKGIKNSMAIITEFSHSLDHTIGGKIADNLEALYDFMIRELLMANLRKDIEKLQVVEKMLMDLRSTWAEAIDINTREQIPMNGMASTGKISSIGSTPNGYVPFSISR
jgi:flagellar secretion chaperone FliS